MKTRFFNLDLLYILIILFIIGFIYIHRDDNNGNKAIDDYYYTQLSCVLWEVEYYDNYDTPQSKNFTTEEISRLTLEPFSRLDPSQMIDLDKAGIGKGNMTVYIQCSKVEDPFKEMMEE